MDAAFADRIEDKLCWAVATKLFEDIVAMGFDAVGTNVESSRDFFLSFPFGQKLEVFAFGHGEKVVGIDSTFLVLTVARSFSELRRGCSGCVQQELSCCGGVQ